MTIPATSIYIQMHTIDEMSYKQDIPPKQFSMVRKLLMDTDMLMQIN